MKQECHLCYQTVQNLAKCTKVRCRNYFCEKCIQENFDPLFTYHSCYKEGYWICYACQNLCPCKLCKGELSIIGKKANSRKRKGPSQDAKELDEKDSSEMNGETNGKEDERESGRDHENAGGMKEQLKAVRIANLRISKPLPTIHKDHFINKFSRKRMVSKPGV